MKTTSPHSVTATIAGESVALYTSSIVARPIKKTAQTIRLLTKAGVMPDTPFRLRRPGGHPIRMYTMEQARVVRDEFNRLGTSTIRPEAHAAFFQAVAAGWAQLGVVPPAGDEGLIWV